jgi:hypothetical protein
MRGNRGKLKKERYCICYLGMESSLEPVFAFFFRWKRWILLALIRSFIISGRLLLLFVYVGQVRRCNTMTIVVYPLSEKDYIYSNRKVFQNATHSKRCPFNLQLLPSTTSFPFKSIWVYLGDPLLTIAVSSILSSPNCSKL